MIHAFTKAIGQLSDPRFLKVIGGSVLLSIGCFVAVWLAVGWALTTFDLTAIEWLDTTLAVLGGLVTLVLTWLFFPMVAIAFLGFFLESIARAVEARHYPDLDKPPGITFWQGLGSTLRFLGLVIVVNIALLVLLFFPPAYPIGYLVGNGLLISREYFDLVALRRVGPAGARQLRSRHMTEMLGIGIATAFMLTVPVLNFLAPVIATAAMVHRFEAWRGLPPPGSLSTSTPPPPPPAGRR
ncbi:MAG: EI24 domain-containing protein [bacterium]|nr:EI24 domain-containing protein [bacterium]